jgi:hypothetical protein
MLALLEYPGLWHLVLDLALREPVELHLFLVETLLAGLEVQSLYLLAAETLESVAPSQ